MFSTLSEWLFNTSGLEAHGYCLLWEPGLIWLYALSDAAIALAYFSIPLAIIVVGQKRSDLVFRPLLWLFAAFILLCGTTHWLDVLTLWVPLYGLQGLVKAATAVASVATAAVLWWRLPDFLALPSPIQLAHANAALLESEKKLAQAQKMEAIGQLTGGIAHDFNNILQVITGSIGVINHQLAHGRGNEIQPAVAAIQKMLTSASNLINRMLAFSLRQTLIPKVLEPDELVASMAEMLRRTLGPEIELDLRLNDSRSSVRCDPSQLEVALLNLAINARDAMPQGGVLKIATADRRLTVADLPDPHMHVGDYVEFEVTDSGVGMSPDIVARAFEPFFTTKAIGKGTGLGLSQVYGFVKQSGGFVRIESGPGKGTSVRIYLPGYDLDITPAGDAKDAPVIPEGPALSRRRQAGKILLVEDEPDVRSQIADELLRAGFSILQASDGISGLQIIESGEPLDLLITDVGLPGLSGRQLAESTRSVRPRLPILLITGYAGDQLKTLQKELHIQVLRKPFSLEEMTDSVCALLESAKT